MTDVPAILQQRFALAEHKRSIFFATVEQHIKPDDVLKPDFWRHVANLPDKGTALANLAALAEQRVA